ncbi:hypothetical protein [Gluconobacter cerinus]|uniref:hypothetical protein n=1 Tax=Gluconobacter cerinus TaxID=38307 RepID=UPI001B8C94F1|nr:hypothetical protein [Gluconobacter cerinus]MBS1069825.1 hypothetical protein [Gluconobacter cerinus]
MAVRHPDKARQELASIPRTEVGQIDLMDPASIDAFSARLHKDPAWTAIQAPENAFRVA